MNDILTLEANLNKLPKSQLGFAQSLISQYKRKGSLSAPQWFHVERLTNIVVNNIPERSTIEIGDLSKIVELFETAAEHLKWPAIRLQLNDEQIKLTMAGAKASVPGSINVAQLMPAGERNIWYGRIRDDGKFEISPAHSALPDGLIELLEEFAEDPARVAAEHGKLTGHCCFCNKHLENENSTEVGYGPICADHYGLPWG
jgi:hypothetical protein